MRLALAQARRASGRTHPNPPVGAVVLRGTRVLGRGATRPPGGAHAEIVAIERARRRHGARALRGATLAVTLEPCAHQGRTGPCADAIVAAGIARVIVGHRDPSSWTGGRGLRRLRAAGVEVVLGVLADECRHQHRGFLSVVEHGRPWVELKLAGSLDGRIATARGESRWITGAPARAFVQRLRERADAVMVGAETALADDPALTARRGRRTVRRPIRVVADSRLRVGPRARLHRAPGESIALHGRDASARRRSALARAGVRLVPLAARAGGVDLRAGLRALAREGITTVLVEGGGTLAGALLRAGLVDEVHWFVAPKLLGGDGRAALGPIGATRLRDAVGLDEPEVRRLGQDLYVRGRVARGSR